MDMDMQDLQATANISLQSLVGHGVVGGVSRSTSLTDPQALNQGQGIFEGFLRMSPGIRWFGARALLAAGTADNHRAAGDRPSAASAADELGPGDALRMAQVADEPRTCGLPTAVFHEVMGKLRGGQHAWVFGHENPPFTRRVRG